LLNAFADQCFYLNKFVLSGGLALNYSNDYGTNFSGGLDLDYQILPSLTSYASLNHAYRLPTFTDLYYSSATHISNPELKPEKATVLEAGLKYADYRLKANADVYYRMANDVIDWVKNPDSIKWESRNYTEINALGADFSLQYQFHSTILRQIKVSYSYLQQDKNSDAYDSKYALDYLKHKAMFGICHNLYKKLSMNWNVVFQDRNGSYTDFATNQKVAYKPFWLTDVRIQWETNKVLIFADVNNLFDITYEDFGGLPQAGRWIKTGIRVSIW
jgi:iron complex outermembrane receptor protein